MEQSNVKETFGDKPLIFEEYHRQFLKNCKEAYKNWLGMCLIGLSREDREKILEFEYVFKYGD
jgi:hypothetical protein